MCFGASMQPTALFVGPQSRDMFEFFFCVLAAAFVFEELSECFFSCIEVSEIDLCVAKSSE